MHCPNCNTKINPTDWPPENDTASCPQCEQRLPAYHRTVETNGWLNRLVRPEVFGSILVILLVGLLWIGYRAWRNTQLPSPTKRVENFYHAIAARDEAVALEFVHPNDRDAGLGFCLNLLLQPNVSVDFTQLDIDLRSKDKSHALVRVVGEATRRLDGRSFAVSFNDQIDLTAANRNWYLTRQSLNDFSLCGDL